MRSYLKLKKRKGIYFRRVYCAPENTDQLQNVLERVLIWKPNMKEGDLDPFPVVCDIQHPHICMIKSIDAIIIGMNPKKGLE